MRFRQSSGGRARPAIPRQSERLSLRHWGQAGPAVPVVTTRRWRPELLIRQGQVSRSLLRQPQKCKNPLKSGLCGVSAVSLWEKSPTRRLYGGGGSPSRNCLHEIPCKWEIYREKFKFQATLNRPTQRKCTYSLGFSPEPDILK